MDSFPAPEKAHSEAVHLYRYEDVPKDWNAYKREEVASAGHLYGSNPLEVAPSYWQDLRRSANVRGLAFWSPHIATEHRDQMAKKISIAAMLPRLLAPETRFRKSDQTEPRWTPAFYKVRPARLYRWGGRQFSIPMKCMPSRRLSLRLLWWPSSALQASCRSLISLSYNAFHVATCLHS